MEFDLFISLITVAVLLLISAFFSASETALTAVSKVHMHTRQKQGDRRAEIVNILRSKKDRLIGALLLGNNLVNILASALATSVFIKIAGEAGVVYATMIMTLLVVIFAEVLPKTYALHHADSAALRLAPLIRIIVVIFSPITEAVAWIVRYCLKIFGVDISKVTAGSHLELLRGVIDMHHGPEEETRKQRAMLRSILELAEVDVSEIMIHRKNVAMINPDEPIADIVQAVLDSPHTRLPIWKDNPDNIVGVIHAKLLLKELNAHGGKASEIRIGEVAMEPWFIPDTTTLYDQLQAFRERREHFAIVVDEYGAFMGIVTLEDILEEIVGDIDDEQDISVPGVRRVTHNIYLMDGTVTIRDLNREFEWGLPDEEYSTLAGLILYESKMLPQVGQSFSFHGFRFDILRRQRNQITKIRILKDQGDSGPLPQA
ncbi:MAG: HlyC/CorC family transporter [Alphaproteobacteria bacterium]|nr:HlyC/CorC family transporter [Alphaproteobacteria bacterium]